MSQVRRHLARRRRIFPNLRRDQRREGRAARLGQRHGRSRRCRQSKICRRPGTACAVVPAILMLDFAFELPLAISGPAIILGLCLFAIGGLLFVRRQVLPRWRVWPTDSECTGAMVQSVMVFYGLALALIAVNVWQ